MNPFITRVKSEQEKLELIEKKRREWDALGAASDLVARDQESFLSKFADTIVIEREPFTAARELTPAELAKQNGEVMFLQIFGSRADCDDTGVAALDALTKANKEKSLRRLLGPGQHAESALESMVRSIVVKAIGNQSVPRHESDRTGLGIVPRMSKAATEQDADSDLAVFLRAYVAGDEKGMRGVARKLASAAA